MDLGIDLFSLLGLKVGDAHMIRNAGGMITGDTIRSLVISQRFLGTREIVLIHHTDCGMQGLDGEKLASALEAETGRRPGWVVDGFVDAAGGRVAGRSRRCGPGSSSSRRRTLSGAS